MAGKGYRPALFELVRKGPLKPNQKGTLTTPKWFYNHKNKGTIEPLRRETKARDDQPQDFSADYVEDSTAYPEPLERPESLLGLHLADKKLAFWAPYWAVGLFFMGLFLGFLVSFWLGQVSVRGTELAVGQPSRAEANPGDIGEGSVQQEMLVPPANPVHKPTAANGESQTANLGNAPGASVTPPVTGDVGTGRNCLVMCSHSSQRELRPVQEYFSKKGVLTKIGRLDGRYIVYCEEGADSPSSSEADGFRLQMVEFGKRYNSEKPSGAASFPPSTFVSAYWAKRDRITKIEQ